VIVADTNLVAYLLLGGQGTEHARQVFLRDPDWAAPFPWTGVPRGLGNCPRPGREIELLSL